MTILVIGATGTVASEAIPELVRKGHTVRAMVHSSAKARQSAEAGAEVVVGDFGDDDSLDRAFAGIETVLLVTPPHARAADWATAGSKLR